jgi:hypothetical protein
MSLAYEPALAVRRETGLTLYADGGAGGVGDWLVDAMDD